MATTTTVVPAGPIRQWCLQPLLTSGKEGLIRNGCADPALGSKPEDFQTICCSGVVLYDSGPRSQLFGPYIMPAVNSSSSSSNFWGWSFVNATINNFVCYDVVNTAPLPLVARLDEDRAVDVDGTSSSSDNIGPCVTLPVPPSASSSPLAVPATRSPVCLRGSPTPLASLAGTNTRGAATAYEAMYIPAPPGDGSAVTATSALAPLTPTALTTTIVPTCLWVNTAHGQAMAQVTVAAVSGAASNGVNAPGTVPLPTPTSGAARLRWPFLGDAPILRAVLCLLCFMMM